jgi:hypothetical protein
VTVVAVACQGIALWQTQAADSADLARWSALASPAPKPVLLNKLALSAAAAASAWRGVDALRYPWPRLLAVVDEVALPGVQWLALQHQIGQPELRLEGLVPDAEVAAALVAALASQPGWTTATLTRLGRAEGAQGVSGLRFEISTRIARPAIDGTPAAR